MSVSTGSLPATFTYWLLAAVPLIVVFVLMVGFQWGGAKAGPAGWIAAFVIGILFFQAGPKVLVYSQFRSVFLTLYVLYIIWMALLLFRIVEAAGAVTSIGRGIVHLTADRVLQLLILSWVFSAFLQGVAGFGVPVAVVAPILIALGFQPVTAVASTAIGHSWSVTFGDIASSFNALIATSGVPGGELAASAAFLLGIACLGCGLAVLLVFFGWKGVLRGGPALLVVGAAMIITQYVLATNRLWNLAGFVAGMVGLVTSAAVTRLPISGTTGSEEETDEDLLTEEERLTLPLGTALLPYLFLIVVVTAAELLGPFHSLLNHIEIGASFPEVTTGLGWTTPAGVGKQISVFGHAGALLAYTSLFAYLLFLFNGSLGFEDAPDIMRNTVRSAIPSSLGIVSMVGMAMIMDHSGMTMVLATGLSRAIGHAFPLLSPFIGLLGAFMTGSNTNSNVVFAPLQKSTAELVRVAVPIILGAQTSGGSLGSMLAPAKVIVGCSTAGLSGEEGRVMRITIPTGLVIAAVIGVVTLLLSWFAT